MKPSKNILIKLSGASLKNEDNIICFKKLDQISSQIKAIKGQNAIGIVLGGGNIWKGATNEKMGMNRSDADNIGMLATIMNSISLKSSLNKNGMKAKVYSALNVPRNYTTFLTQQGAGIVFNLLIITAMNDKYKNVVLNEITANNKFNVFDLNAETALSPNWIVEKDKKNKN